MYALQEFKLPCGWYKEVHSISPLSGGYQMQVVSSQLRIRLVRKLVQTKQTPKPPGNWLKFCWEQGKIRVLFFDQFTKICNNLHFSLSFYDSFLETNNSEGIELAWTHHK